MIAATRTRSPSIAPSWQRLSAPTTTSRLSALRPKTQWAAVSTPLGATSVPPQNWPWKMSSLGAEALMIAAMPGTGWPIGDRPPGRGRAIRTATAPTPKTAQRSRSALRDKDGQRERQDVFVRLRILPVANANSVDGSLCGAGPSYSHQHLDVVILPAAGSGERGSSRRSRVPFGGLEAVFRPDCPIELRDVDIDAENL